MPAMRFRRSAGILVLFVVTMIVLVMANGGTAPVALAAGGPSATPASPQGSPTANHCSKLGCPHPRSGATPYTVFPNDTGQQTIAKPSIEYCNNRLYVAWTGTDGQLNVGWGATSGPFTSVTTFYGYKAYEDQGTNPSIYSGPAIQCWYGANGLGQQLYIAWTDPNAQLHVGFFDGVQSHHYILHDYAVGGNTSHYTPALTVSSPDNLLRLAFTGTNDRPYIIRSSDGQTWTAQNGYSGKSAAGGPGFAWGGTSSYPLSLYISWVSTGSPYSLNLSNFSLSSGTWSNQTFGYTSQNHYDASLAAVGGTLYLPYAGSNGDLNVLHTSNSVWTNTNELWSSGQGVSIAINNSDGHLYLVWKEAGLYTNELDISVYP